MVQNRKKLIDILIGNLSNFVIHRTLEKSGPVTPEINPLPISPRIKIRVF